MWEGSLEGSQSGISKLDICFPYSMFGVNQHVWFPCSREGHVRNNFPLIRKNIKDGNPNSKYSLNPKLAILNDVNNKALTPRESLSMKATINSPNSDDIINNVSPNSLTPRDPLVVATNDVNPNFSGKTNDAS